MRFFWAVAVLGICLQILPNKAVDVSKDGSYLLGSLKLQKRETKDEKVTTTEANIEELKNIIKTEEDQKDITGAKIKKDNENASEDEGSQVQTVQPLVPDDAKTSEQTTEKSVDNGMPNSVEPISNNLGSENPEILTNDQTVQNLPYFSPPILDYPSFIPPSFSVPQFSFPAPPNPNLFFASDFGPSRFSSASTSANGDSAFTSGLTGEGGFLENRGSFSLENGIVEPAGTTGQYAKPGAYYGNSATNTNTYVKPANSRTIGNQFAQTGPGYSSSGAYYGNSGSTANAYVSPVSYRGSWGQYAQTAPGFSSSTAYTGNAGSSANLYANQNQQDYYKKFNEYQTALEKYYQTLQQQQLDYQRQLENYIKTRMDQGISSDITSASGSASITNGKKEINPNGQVSVKTSSSSASNSDGSSPSVNPSTGLATSSSAASGSSSASPTDRAVTAATGGFPSYSQTGSYSSRPGAYSQTGSYAQPGAYSQTGNYAQPGAYSQTGGYAQPAAYSQTGSYAQPGAYSQIGSYAQPGTYSQSLTGSYQPQSYSGYGGSYSQNPYANRLNSQSVSTLNTGYNSGYSSTATPVGFRGGFAQATQTASSAPSSNTGFRGGFGETAQSTGTSTATGSNASFGTFSHSGPGVAQSKIVYGPQGGYQAGSVSPAAPNVNSRFGEALPPPSGKGTVGVFSSSTSESRVGPDGKVYTYKESTTGVNDNGKITFKTVKSE